MTPPLCADAAKAGAGFQLEKLMGLLNSQLLADAAAFTDTDGFGESVTYYPKSGPPRPIHAIVWHNPPARLDGGGNVITPKLLIEVANSATTGISALELNTGSDMVGASIKPGDAQTRLSVGRSMGQDSMDPGMLTLELN